MVGHYVGFAFTQIPEQIRIRHCTEPFIPGLINGLKMRHVEIFPHMTFHVGQQ